MLSRSKRSPRRAVPRQTTSGTNLRWIEPRLPLMRRRLIRNHSTRAESLGVSTGILVFTKGGRTDNVFFYDVEWDGFSLDDKRDPVPENDLPDCLARWTSAVLPRRFLP